MTTEAAGAWANWLRTRDRSGSGPSLIFARGEQVFSVRRFPGCSARTSRTHSAGPRRSPRRHYDQIARGRSYFGDFDPFGDFDLIFGAARSLKIVDLPIRYRDRVYGRPNISRWRDGRLLLRMVLFALSRIKFV